MRISDWISDVCSSDLHRRLGTHHRPQHHHDRRTRSLRARLPTDLSMGMAHHHAGHSHGSDNERRVLWALLLTASFMMVEVVGGLISGSLGLLADAAHMLTDAAALALALVAFRLARRPAAAQRPSRSHPRQRPPPSLTR